MAIEHPLDGCRIKIVRAEEYIEFLDDKIGEYLSTDPYEIVVKVHGNDRIPLVRAKGAPPLCLSAVIGDCLYNLRASLDLLVWQLALVGPGKARLSHRPNLYFPIFVEPRKFENNWNNALKPFLSAGTKTPLENVQSYNAGYESLATLHTLSCQDKHRLPILTVNIPTMAHVITTIVEEEDRFHIAGRGAYVATSHQLDTELALKPLDVGQDVQVKGHAAGFIAFQDLPMPREPAEILLGKIAYCIKNLILPKFEAFFEFSGLSRFINYTVKG